MEHFRSTLAHITGGRRYCFVITSFRGGYAFFERVRQVVSESTGCECVRADDIPQVGDLRAKIHAAIDAAAFVIADVSDPRPNVYYEVGYTVAKSKPLLVLARNGAEIESDLHGVEVVRYADTNEGWLQLEASLRSQLAIHRDGNVSLLRSMLVPRNPHPSYVVANPKIPTEDSRHRRHPRERRTYGDYLGVVGVLGAFASVYGEHFVPEIVTAAWATDDLATWDANLYLIGSFKVNRFAAIFLNAMQEGKSPCWQFQRAPQDEGIADFNVLMSCGTFADQPENDNLRRAIEASRGSGCTDVGLIVRGPHPRHPQRIVTVLAGQRSLGTGAACLAASKSVLIRQIRDQLVGSAELTDHEKTIWALVQGTRSSDRHIDTDGVEIVGAGVYADGKASVACEPK